MSGGVGWREYRQRDQLGSLVWRESEEEEGGRWGGGGAKRQKARVRT